MDAITIHIEGDFDPEADFRAATEAVAEELRLVGIDIAERAVGILRDAGAKATGDLIAAVHERVEVELGRVRLSVGPFGVSYARYVHDGTRPHWAPIAPFKKWARAKFGGGPDSERIAYAARAAVARRGTRAVPFMADALAPVRGTIARRVSDAFLHAFRSQN